jgi:hypothetical protein
MLAECPIQYKGTRKQIDRNLRKKCSISILLGYYHNRVIAAAVSADLLPARGSGSGVRYRPSVEVSAQSWQLGV